MARSAKGFTMVELMIVVSIISVLSCIAIPILLRSKMAANEAAAVQGVRSILAGQAMYVRTDWDKDGVLSYASDISQLYMMYGTEINIVSKQIAAARYGTPTTTPWQGYCYLDAAGYFVGAKWQPQLALLNGRVAVCRYGIHSFPEAYLVSGANCYAGDDSGKIWMKDASTDYFFVNAAAARPLWDNKGMQDNGWGSIE